MASSEKGKKRQAPAPAVADVPDEEIVNPGDCVGHWLDGDKACEMCEIQDSCRDMTAAIRSKEGEDGSGN